MASSMYCKTPARVRWHMEAVERTPERAKRFPDPGQQSKINFAQASEGECVKRDNFVWKNCAHNKGQLTPACPLIGIAQSDKSTMIARKYFPVNFKLDKVSSVGCPRQSVSRYPQYSPTQKWADVVTEKSRRASCAAFSKPKPDQTSVYRTNVPRSIQRTSCLISPRNLPNLQPAVQTKKQLAYEQITAQLKHSDSVPPIKPCFSSQQTISSYREELPSPSPQNTETMCALESVLRMMDRQLEILGFDLSAPYVTFLPGQSIFRRYKILSQLGAGTFAKVYQLRDTHTGEIVAGKLLEPNKFGEISQERIIELFCNEIKHSMQCQCPGILEVKKAVRGTEGWIIIQEYIDGGTLWSNSETLNETNYFAFMLQLTQAVIYMQSQKIVHRDLKPTNLLRTADHQLLLVTDFGWSECYEKLDENDFESPGTIEINPPEIRGRHLQRTEKIDNYAVAMIMMLLTSQCFVCRDPTLDHENAAWKILDSIHMIRSGDPMPNFTPDAWEVFLGLSHFNPEERYSMRDVICSKWFLKSLDWYLSDWDQMERHFLQASWDSEYLRRKFIWHPSVNAIAEQLFKARNPRHTPMIMHPQQMTKPSLPEKSSSSEQENSSPYSGKQNNKALPPSDLPQFYQHRHIDERRTSSKIARSTHNFGINRHSSESANDAANFDLASNIKSQQRTQNIMPKVSQMDIVQRTLHEPDPPVDSMNRPALPSNYIVTPKQKSWTGGSRLQQQAAFPPQPYADSGGDVLFDRYFVRKPQQQTSNSASRNGIQVDASRMTVYEDIIERVCDLQISPQNRTNFPQRKTGQPGKESATISTTDSFDSSTVNKKSSATPAEFDDRQNSQTAFSSVSDRFAPLNMNMLKRNHFDKSSVGPLTPEVKKTNGGVGVFGLKPDPAAEQMLSLDLSSGTHLKFFKNFLTSPPIRQCSIASSQINSNSLKFS